jgi:hypothetical protein
VADTRRVHSSVFAARCLEVRLGVHLGDLVIPKGRVGADATTACVPDTPDTGKSPNIESPGRQFVDGIGVQHDSVVGRG